MSKDLICVRFLEQTDWHNQGEVQEMIYDIGMNYVLDGKAEEISKKEYDDVTFKQFEKKAKKIIEKQRKEEEKQETIKQKQEEIIQEHESMDVFSFQELLKRDIKPIKYIVDNLLAEEGITVLGGDSGVGKSWFSMYLALKVSKGYTLFDTFNSTKAKVLYLDEENGDRATYTRLKMLMPFFNMKNEKPDFENIIYSNRENIKLDTGKFDKDKAGYLKFRYLIEKYKPKVCIIDSFVRFFLGEENSSSDVSKVYDTLKWAIKEHKTSFLLLHHTTKNNANGYVKHSLRGSGDISAQADNVLMCSKLPRSNKIKVEQMKNRHDKELDKPFNVMIGEVEGMFSISYGGSVEVEKETIFQDGIKVLCDMIAQNNWIEIHTKIALKQFVSKGQNKPNYYRVLDELLQHNLIKKVSNGKYEIKDSFKDYYEELCV